MQKKVSFSFLYRTTIQKFEFMQTLSNCSRDRLKLRTVLCSVQKFELFSTVPTLFKWDSVRKSRGTVFVLSMEHGTLCPIESVLIIECEDAVVRVSSIEHLIDCTLDNAYSSEDGSLHDENDHADNHSFLPSLKELLRVLTLSAQVLKCRDFSGADLRRVLLSC